MTQMDQIEGLRAVAKVVKSLGFDAMAEEFILKPEYRVRIVLAMSRQIAKKDQLAAANFRRLASNFVEGIAAV